MEMLSDFWFRIQNFLFPCLEEALDEPLTARLMQLVSILEIIRIEEHVPSGLLQRIGRKRLDRRCMARAFVAKAVYNLATTELLIEMLNMQPSLRRICGWERRADIPSAPTFSRAFKEFAEEGLADKAHQALVNKFITKEDITQNIVQHVSRDSTEIVAREKPLRKPKKEPKPKLKRGRPSKGEVRDPVPLTRLQEQMEQSPEEAIALLPIVCDVGTKKDTKGYKHSWVGWKAHVDWSDSGLPLTVVTTSASLHDSQVAIPLSRITSQRVTSLYDLMDSAYDADLIHEVSKSLGHVPIIDPHPRRKEPIPLDPAKARRYHQRTVAERGNARLKDEFGGRCLRVRGHAKAHQHIMFGMVALFADQLLKIVT